ncbi:FliG C-terminal domain-containing protein [Streptomyces syringium]|uniref:FliG C-terminal domain-containing protein n=1 Tax=Streptomyces syringium TaxID=76729 RepID=UPI00369ABD09
MPATGKAPAVLDQQVRASSWQPHADARSLSAISPSGYQPSASRRAADVLRDDMAARGPVKMSEVEDKQKELLAIAPKLSAQGDTIMPSGEENYV